MSKISLKVDNPKAREILVQYGDLDAVRHYLGYLRNYTTELVYATLQGK